jgi:DNA replication protein DnaC
MRYAGYGHTSDAMHRARSTGLLVLDDLGIEAVTEQNREWLCELVWSRADSERRGRITVVTTSLGPDAISARYGDGMSRRLFQLASIHLGGSLAK